jgi:hypothetical protein
MIARRNTRPTLFLVSAREVVALAHDRVPSRFPHRLAHCSRCADGFSSLQRGLLAGQQPFGTVSLPLLLCELLLSSPFRFNLFASTPCFSTPNRAVKRLRLRNSSRICSGTPFAPCSSTRSAYLRLVNCHSLALSHLFSLNPPARRFCVLQFEMFWIKLLSPLIQG